MTSPDFTSITELPGDDVSREQVERICRRYYWAAGYCGGRDVLEAACGGGQGLGLLGGLSRSLIAGDFSEDVLAAPRSHYGDRVDLQQFDATEMPFADHSLDVVILFEAIYYLPDAEKFVGECARVLRPGGHVLIATANPDLYDFSPSPYTHRYYGVLELKELFTAQGFQCAFFGDTPLEEVSLQQKVLRPIKKIVVSLGLMPRSKLGKAFLKRFVFGGLVTMPPEIDANTAPGVPPVTLPADQPDRAYKVLYCAAELIR